MALYDTGTYTTEADFLSHLATFLGDNGWTVNTSTSTETSVTKGDITFRFVRTAAVTFAVYGIVNSVQSSAVYINYLNVGYDYWFYTYGSSVYILQMDGTESFFSFGAIVDAQGTQTGNFYLSAHRSAASNDNSLKADAYYGASTLYNGTSWSTVSNTKLAGDFWGSRGSNYITAGPNRYNLAVVPIPVLLCKWDSSVTYLIPLGFAEGIYMFFPRTFYETGDQLTISGVTYIINKFHSVMYRISA